MADTGTGMNTATDSAGITPSTTPSAVGNPALSASISRASVSSVAAASSASASASAASVSAVASQSAASVSASESAASASNSALSVSESLASASLSSASVASVSSASLASLASTSASVISSGNSVSTAFVTITPSATPDNNSGGGGGGTRNVGAIVGGTVGGFVGLLALLGLLFFLWRRNKNKEEFDGNFDPAHVGGSPPHVDLPPEDYAQHAALTNSPGATSAGLAGLGAAGAGGAAMSQYDGNSYVSHPQSAGMYGAPASSYDHSQQSGYYDANQYASGEHQGMNGVPGMMNPSPGGETYSSDPSTYYSNQPLQPNGSAPSQPNPYDNYESYAAGAPSNDGHQGGGAPPQVPASLIPGGTSQGHSHNG